MTEPILATFGLTKSFGAVRACDDVSLSLFPGEIHAVIGPNGAGKSTLIQQICGALKPDAGRIALLGRDVTAAPTRARARMGLARTFQISALAMQDTVLQNVTLGALGARGGAFNLLGNALGQADLRAVAMTALTRVGLADHAATRAAELSHGQRRQLEVAVALTLSPRAFVMDEPMAGMGTEGSQRMTGFLDGLRSEAPILLVEHDMDAVFALADRLSVLVYGRIIATGSVDEIRKDPQVRRAYLGEDMTLLALHNITAFYGASQALFGVSLRLDPGEVVALMGRNGMGKSTTVKCICGLMPVRAGRVTLDGTDITRLPAHRTARLGIGLVPEGRRCFPNLTVQENLSAAARWGHWDFATVTGLFPRLAERRGQSAATLSGGEQQMLAIARALMTNPRILILDEATEGLAPIVRQEIWAAIATLKRESGLAILIVDKSLRELGRIADRAVILQRGQSVWSGGFGDLDAATTHRLIGV